jgi:hypothetical protein
MTLLFFQSKRYASGAFFEGHLVMRVIADVDRYLVFTNFKKQVIRFNHMVFNGLLLGAAIGSSAALAQEWLPLGGSLTPEAGGLVQPSLAADPRVNPILGFDNYESGTTTVLRWHGDTDTWESFGPNILGTSGPSVGLDADKRIYLCSAGKYAVGIGSPNVFRWSDRAWRQIGGDIAVEAGYNAGGGRHVVDACAGIALNSSSNPIVTWTALVGAKTWAVFAARWNEDQKSWKGLGEGAVTAGRSVSTYVDVNANDRPYLATTSTSGAGISRVTTTQVWRWNNPVWTQLGADMPGAANAVIGFYENTTYLALNYTERDPDTGAFLIDELRVMRWGRGIWQALPSPGKGSVGGDVKLGFTYSGKPVIAYIESPDEGLTLNIIVKYWNGKIWKQAGEAVTSASCSLPSCYPQVFLDLSFDSKGRPIVAWGETNYKLASDGSYVPVNRLNVKRYSGDLP